MDEENEIDMVLARVSGDKEQEAALASSKSSSLAISESRVMFRLIRLLTFLQTLAFVFDHPSIQLPTFCYIFLKGPLFYTLHFFSKPFLDALYLLRAMYNSDSTESSAASSSDSSMQWFQNSFDINVLDAHFWHTIQSYWHFTAGYFFVLLALHFTLYSWGIRDYSDKKETKAWLDTYVGPSWFVRGTASGLLLVLKFAGLFICFVLLFNALNTSLNSDSTPSGRLSGSLLGISLVVLFLSLLLMLWCLSCVRSLFLRYASQNVDQTSSIILKEVLKAKIEIGVLLLLALYMPVLSTFVKSVMPITDWNDDLAMAHRVHYNFYSYCYLLAFPPYRLLFSEEHRSCPFSASLDPSQLATFPGFYNDVEIAACDSIVGVILFTLGAIGVVALVTVYFWLFHRFIRDVNVDLQASKWVPHIISLDESYTETLKAYQKEFTRWARFELGFKVECSNQYRYYGEALRFGTGALRLSSVVLTPFARLVRFAAQYTPQRLASLLVALSTGCMAVAKQCGEATRRLAQYAAHRVLQLPLNALRRRPRLYSPIETREAQLKAQLQGGDWRMAAKIESRRQKLADLRAYSALEMTKVCRGFASDHTQLITALDATVDSSGLVLLLSSFRWRHRHYLMLMLTEMTVLAALSSILCYAVDWDLKAGLIASHTAVFALITYALDPFVETEDKWVDHLGRVMVIVAVLGLLLCDALATSVGVAHQGSGTAPMHNTWSTSSLNLQDTVVPGSGLFVVVDMAVVAYVYAYTLTVLYRAGAFAVARRTLAGVQYSMDVSILNFIVARLQERTIGAENVYTGLALAQQWDDILDHQRNHHLLAWPDVQPPYLLSTYEKLVYIQWAAAFNLTIPTLKSTLGLTLLHVTMGAGSSEVSRWLVHRYPALLGVPDNQKDTPIMVALKETAKYLSEYSRLNGGMLDDGTSYDDDYFDEIYPEVHEIRNEYKEFGDFIGAKMAMHLLTAKELNMLEMDKRHIKSKKKNAKLLLTEVDASKKLIVRYPEDNVYEDKNSGLVVSWLVLGIAVPSSVLFMDHEDAEFTAEDLENGIEPELVNISSEVVHKADKRYTLKRQHPMRRRLKDWDSRMSSVTKRRMALANAWKGGRKAFQDMWTRLRYETVEEKIRREDQARINRQDKGHLESRWSVCRYAEILLSDETRRATATVKWDLALFKAFNQMANRLEGKLCQHLALVCDLHPPEGFALISEWSSEIPRDQFDEGLEEDQDAAMKTLLAVGQAVENIGTNINAVRERLSRLLKRKQDRRSQYVFNDRLIHFLAECLVSSREKLDLSDCQLSGPGRIAWRAVCRALRRRSCSFILPGVVVEEKLIRLTHLKLESNGLDCADCVLVGEAVRTQLTLQYLDLSRNRIGARGMLLLMSAIRIHRKLSTFKIDFNRIGPAVGADLELFIGDNRLLRVLTLSHNSLGAMTRYSTSLSFDHIPTAGPMIFRGLRRNRSIQLFDVSYNSLGPSSFQTSSDGSFIQSNTSLHTLLISGNDFGPVAGANILLSLAGSSNPSDSESLYGSSYTKSVSFSAPAKSIASSPESLGRSMSQDSRAPITKHPRCRLHELSITDNQLGIDAGAAAALVLNVCRTLCVLDVSGNAIGTKGGVLIADAIKLGLRVREREIAAALAKQSAAPSPSKKQRGFSLHTLKMSRCSLGPKVLSLLMASVAAPNCTLINLDLSRNPFGFSTHSDGDTDTAGNDLKSALASNTSLLLLNLSETSFSAGTLVPILGGIAAHHVLVTLHLSHVSFDSPTCLQVARVLELCASLRHVDLSGGAMGPKGGVLVCKAVEKAAGRLVAVNLTGNRVGSISCIALHTALMMPTCSLQTLLLASNDVCDDGANVLARALLQNDSLTELDLSNNGLTEEGAVALASAFRGKYSDGRKLANLRLKKLLISSNPAIGKVGARALLQSFTEGLLEHFEAADIGAGEDAAACVAKGVRDVAVLWRHINCAYNSFGRVGLNTICWGLRVNRRVKVVNLGSSKAGLAFGTPTDALGIHGISLARMVAENTTLTMLDLSHNNLSSEAGIVLFNALKANFSLTLVNLRGNQFDDEVESALGDLLATNDIIEELDIGDNKLGCRACYAISTGLCYNNSIRVMKMDSNRFGYFKSDAFVHLGRMIGYNTTIRRMHLDDNRVGAEGGTLVAQGVARNSTLVSLSMHNNRLDSRSGREMVNAYRHNTVMVELSLTEDEVGQDVWEDFRAVRESKRAFINPLADD